MLASTTGGVSVNGERRSRAPEYLHEHIIAIKKNLYMHTRTDANTHARALGVGSRSLARHESQLNQLKPLALRLQAKYPETDKHTHTHTP